MLSREDKLLRDLLVRRGILSSREVTAAESERGKSVPHLSLSEFLLARGVLRELPDDRDTQLPLPEQLGEYSIIREIGRGGTGVVYEAIQTSLGRRVALKVLLPSLVPSQLQAERLEREARSVARLKHPNIVTVHAAGAIAGRAYIAMELVTGQSLEEGLERGALEPHRAALIARAIAQALGAAHDAGLVHRDVKPSNILLDRHDEPMLTDFGLVHDQSASRLTISASVLGTPAYMSAEQARGEAPRPEHDVYSLGAVLFAMLAGRAPYLGELPSAVLSQVLTQPPPPLSMLRPDAPRALVAICEKAMSRDERDRYRTCQEVVGEFDRYLEGTRTEAERSAARAARHRGARRFLLGAGIVGAVAIGAWLIEGGRPSGERRGGARLADGPRAIRRITATPGLELEPSLSPTGEWFAYASPRDGDFDIYVDRTGEQRPENVTPDWDGMDVQPAVSPSGRAIAFRSDRSGGGVFVLDVSSRAVRRVAKFGYHPAWSPDGKTIAVSTEQVYGVGRSPRNTQSEIWTIDVSTGEQERLVSADAVQPAWSPGGSRLAFWGKRGNVTGLWTVGRTGEDVVPCSIETETVRDPVWMVSGEALLVTARASEASNLRAIGINEETGECSREPVPDPSRLPWKKESGVTSC